MLAQEIYAIANSVENCKMGRMGTQIQAELHSHESKTKLQCAKLERKTLFVQYHIVDMLNVVSVRRTT